MARFRVLNKQISYLGKPEFAARVFGVSVDDRPAEIAAIATEHGIEPGDVFTHADEGSIVDDIPAQSVDNMIAQGWIEAVPDAPAPAPAAPSVPPPTGDKG